MGGDGRTEIEKRDDSMTDRDRLNECPVGDLTMPDEPPIGAIENGREHLRRLAEFYDFQEEAGHLKNCSDYQEAVRCFEHMAEWIQAHAK